MLCFVLMVCILLPLCGCGKNDEQINEVSQLNGKTIVAVSGTVSTVPVKERSDLKNAECVYALNNANALSMLLAGKADAMVADNVFALSTAKKYNSLVVLDEMMDEADYGIAFRNGSPLADEFNAMISELKSDGTLDRLIEKWIQDDSTEKTVTEQTWKGNNGTIKCCVALDNEPMCYEDDSGNLAGLDIDLVLAIAQRLDYSVVFSTSDFEDLIPTVMAGQADIAVSGITITEARDSLVDFSAGYFKAGTVFLVRDSSAVSSGASIKLFISDSLHRVFAENDRWLAMLRGLGVTLVLCVSTAITGLIFGSGIYLWDYSGSKIAKKLFKATSRVVSLLPISTYLLLIYYIIFAGKAGSGFWAAILGFTLTFGLDVYNNLKASVGTLNKGQQEAAFAMGYGKFEALVRIFLPQALPNFLSAMQGCVIGHIRCTAIVEFIAVQDFQAVADMIHADTNEPFLTVILPAIVYIVLAALASRLIGRIKINLDPTDKTPEEIKARALKG